MPIDCGPYPGALSMNRMPPQRHPSTSSIAVLNAASRAVMRASASENSTYSPCLCGAMYTPTRSYLFNCSAIGGLLGCDQWPGEVEGGAGFGCVLAALFGHRCKPSGGHV